jgi:hypothetical protein
MTLLPTADGPLLQFDSDGHRNRRIVECGVLGLN